MCPVDMNIINVGVKQMDEETKALLRSIAHHLRWVIVVLVAILALLVAQVLQ